MRPTQTTARQTDSGDNPQTEYSQPATTTFWLLALKRWESSVSSPPPPTHFFFLGGGRSTQFPSPLPSLLFLRLKYQERCQELKVRGTGIITC